MIRHATTGLAVLLAAVLLAGCAGVRPAVKPQPQPEVQKPPPPPPAETVAPADTSKKQVVVDVMSAPVRTPVPPPMPADTTSEADDAIELPPDALPGATPELAAIPFLKNEGPQPRGPEPPDLVDGWKVQVASVLEEDGAKRIEADLRKHTQDSVHVRWQHDRYTILAGNFLRKADAIKLKNSLISYGYPGAFVVKAPVVVKSPGTPPDSVKAPEPPAPQVAEKDTVDGWRVQVMSLADHATAVREAATVAKRTGMAAYVEEVEGLFKVRAGDFRTRDAASAARGKLIKAGFEGAFPVETRIVISK